MFFYRFSTFLSEAFVNVSSCSELGNRRKTFLHLVSHFNTDIMQKYWADGVKKLPRKCFCEMESERSFGVRESPNDVSRSSPVWQGEL